MKKGVKKPMRRDQRHDRSNKKTARAYPQLSGKLRIAIAAERSSTDVTYEIVQHDGGWAYKVNGVFSEPYPTRAEALDAAQAAAAEQERPGDAETIEYEDDKGKWHSETVSGRDRPHAVVKDTNS
jgi:Uncharacterized protein conserved in bacteria (DUF2188)